MWTHFSELISQIFISPKFFQETNCLTEACLFFILYYYIMFCVSFVWESTLHGRIHEVVRVKAGTIDWDYLCCFWDFLYLFQPNIYFKNSQLTLFNHHGHRCVWRVLELRSAEFEARILRNLKILLWLCFTKAFYNKFVICLGTITAGMLFSSCVPYPQFPWTVLTETPLLLEFLASVIEQAQCFNPNLLLMITKSIAA